MRVPSLVPEVRTGGDKIGILGGTFDPIHVGHLRSAEEVREALGLDEVWFLPALVPPHKGHTPAPFEYRFEMVRLSLQGMPGLEAKDFEAHRPGPSYTVDTLQRLAKEFPGKEWFFIMGSDGFLEIKTWKEYGKLVSLASMVVMGRDGAAFKRCRELLKETYPGYRRGEGGAWVHPSLYPIIFLEITHLAVSSTMIRRLRSEGRSVRFLVPEGVRLYMEEKGLYVKKRAENPKKTSMDSRSLALALARAAVDNKGENVVVLDVNGASSFADYFVIAHGRSTRHVQGMADNIRRDLKKLGAYPRSVEGESEAKWILMDYGDVIVHLFYEPVRGFYDLEGLWHDVPRLQLQGQESVDHEGE